MRPKVFRMLLAIVPATLAFLLVSIFAMVLSRDIQIAAFSGAGASLTSTVIILRH